MIDTLITSQTRIKLLKKFFLNSSTRAHLRGLESEFGESSNAIRVELNRFEGAGLLKSHTEGNKKLYQANRNHPLYKDIHNLVLKETGIDQIIENIIHRIGELENVYLTGDFATGKDSDKIEIILVGNNLDYNLLNIKVRQAENLIGRKIEFRIMTCEESKDYLYNIKPAELLPLWNNYRDADTSI